MRNETDRPPEFGANHGLALAFTPASHTAGWVVSYADMMTIVLTFFIMLLSIARIPQTSFDMLVEALTGRQVGNLREVKERIDQVIADERLGGEVVTELDEYGLKIEFSNALLFPSGQSELTPRADRVFEPIGRHLVADLEPQYGLVIEGYTDDVPISNAQYRSNWELSTSRAIHVMKRLAEAGLDPLRMSVQGFADTRAAVQVDLHDPEAVAGLTSKELDHARAVNRRVVLHIDRLSAAVLTRLAHDRPGFDASPGADQRPAVEDGHPSFFLESAPTPATTERGQP